MLISAVLFSRRDKWSIELEFLGAHIIRATISNTSHVRYAVMRFAIVKNVTNDSVPFSIRNFLLV